VIVPTVVPVVRRAALPRSLFGGFLRAFGWTSVLFIVIIVAALYSALSVLARGPLAIDAGPDTADQALLVAGSEQSKNRSTPGESLADLPLIVASSTPRSSAGGAGGGTGRTGSGSAAASGAGATTTGGGSGSAGAGGSGGSGSGGGGNGGGGGVVDPPKPPDPPNPVNSTVERVQRQVAPVIERAQNHVNQVLSGVTGKGKASAPRIGPPERSHSLLGR
jgi:hypothetical protein